jgi:mannose-1-phosphate guanylyltransferase
MSTSSDVEPTTEAVVLVGGLGTRLRPLTLSAPKPMLPTAGVPFLAHLLARIRDAGVTRIVLGTSYRPEVFESYFGDGSSFGIELEYVVEAEPLGTGGGIRNVAARLRADNVLIFNGDVLSGADLRSLLRTHEETDAAVTLLLTRVEDPRAFGCVPTDEAGRVIAFLEKDANPVTNQVNAGTYVFRRSVIETIPVGRAVSVERETFPELLAAGAVVMAHVDTSYWRDLGQPSDFVAGSADLVRGVVASSALPGPTGESLVFADAQIDLSAQLSGGSCVGADCVIAAGAQIEGSVLFDRAHVGAGAIVRRSVLGFGAVVRAGAVVEDAVVGDGAVIDASVEVLAGERIWPGTIVSATAGVG